MISDIRRTPYGESFLQNHYAYGAKDGTRVIETDWHLVKAMEGAVNGTLDKLRKGCSVHVLGRLRMQRYIAEDGSPRSFVEVLASQVEILPETVEKD